MVMVAEHGVSKRCRPSRLTHLRGSDSLKDTEVVRIRWSGCARNNGRRTRQYKSRTEFGDGVVPLSMRRKAGILSRKELNTALDAWWYVLVLLIALICWGHLSSVQTRRNTLNIYT